MSAEAQEGSGGGAPWLLDHERAWASAHATILEEVVAAFVRGEGEWPRRADLQRALAAEASPPPDLGDIFGEMPRRLGSVQPPDDRIVLSVFGLERTARGRRVLEGVVRALRLAVERYPSGSERPTLSWGDIARDANVPPAVRRATGEVLLREAPFLNGGSGSFDDLWERDISESVVRYWHVERVHDYLAQRAAELATAPPPGRPSLPTVDPGRPDAPLSEPGAQPSHLIVALAGALSFASILVSIVLTPAWLAGAAVGGVLAVAALHNAVWQWPPRLWACALVAGAAIVGATFATAVPNIS